MSDFKAQLAPVADLAALGAEWRAFEAKADGSFFQSWTWTGCLADARFSDPCLLRVTQAGRVVALGLFNRRRNLWGRAEFRLGESGDPGWDAVFIEENGLLLAREVAAQRDEVIAAGLAAFGGARVILSGVDEAHLRAAGRRGSAREIRPAPFIDLVGEVAPPSGAPSGGFLAGCSANTRQQLRRSARSYAARGAISLRRAATVAEAHACLDALATLHQQSWTKRGKPGAFANPRFRQFHRELIARGHPRGEIDLLCLSAGEEVFAYLYQFLWRGQVASYQSGFDFAGARRHEKPGLTAHHLAIEHYAAKGARCYDFLAGAARYKKSLANNERIMYWITLDRWGLRRWARCLRRARL